MWLFPGSGMGRIEGFRGRSSDFPDFLRIPGLVGFIIRGHAGYRESRGKARGKIRHGDLTGVSKVISLIAFSLFLEVRFRGFPRKSGLGGYCRTLLHFIGD